MSSTNVKSGKNGQRGKISAKDFIDSKTWKAMSKEEREKTLAKRQKNAGKPAKTWNSNGDARQATPADKLLKAVGGHGTDTRNTQRETRAMVAESELVQGVDPTLDVPVQVDDRALQYLAAGTVLRAIRRGWLTQQLDNDVHPYYAWIYLIKAYRSAVNGSVPLLQQAPKWFWEVCYALKPKTERFKTGDINYTCKDSDTLSEGVVPAVRWSLGPIGEEYVVFWGLTPASGAGTVNGFPILVGPSSSYDDTLGEESVKALWQSFNAEGLNELTGDPGTDAWFYRDTSAQAAAYSELGSSYGAPGGEAITVYSERFIDAPMLSKFVIYQENEFLYRGWHEFRKSAGSATYIGPRCTEFKTPREMRNKVSPTFLVYNFDEYVEVGSQCIGRWLEETSNAQGVVQIPPYPLTALQFQCILRQALIPFFNNDMAQDLRYSALDSQGTMITMLPLVVGPNGNSLTQQSSSMKMGRFFVEMVRCVKRQIAELRSKFKGDNSQIKDLVPLICRPGGVPQLGNYNWTNKRTSTTELVFKVEPSEVAIDLISCSATIASNEVFIDLNGTQLMALTNLHNEWFASLSTTTAKCDMSATEQGVPALNANTYTNLVSFVFPIQVQENQSGENSSIAARKAAIPALGNRSAVKFDQKWADKGVAVLAKQPSKSKLIVAGLPLMVKKVGVSPIDNESDFFQKKTAMVKTSSTFPVLRALWKYSSIMIKPMFFVIAPALQASYVQYQSVQVQPYTIPIAARESQFALTNSSNTNPNMFDQHLIAANMDVRGYGQITDSEMETDMNAFQRSGKGGFFADIGSIIGGYVDRWF